jgi:hypothetical protein
VSGIKIHTLSITLVTTLALLVAPTEAFAVIQRLNSQAGQTQTFQNDSNLTISSSNNIHSLGWQGLLPLSRGGTGASAFTSGSILFSNGTTLAQDNSNLFWDNSNKRLGIGTSSPTASLSVLGNTSITGDLDVSGNITTTNLIPYTGATQDVDLGTNSLSTSLINVYNVPNLGSIDFYSDNGDTLIGSIWPTPAGQYNFFQGINTNGILNFSSLTSPDKTFTFPNISGTFGLLEASQTWSGLNKFEGTNSTIYVGSLAKSGCIALGDSDNSGVTYITANDGVLTASSTKPSVCQ